MEKKKKRCPKCGSTQCYFRIKTGDMVCRDCLSVTPIKKGSNKNEN